MERSISFFSTAALQILGPVSIAIIVAALLGCVLFSVYRRKQHRVCKDTINPPVHMIIESMDEVTARGAPSDDAPDDEQGRVSTHQTVTEGQRIDEFVEQIPTFKAGRG